MDHTDSQVRGIGVTPCPSNVVEGAVFAAVGGAMGTAARRCLKQGRGGSISRLIDSAYGEGVKKMILGDVGGSRVVEYHGAFGTTDVLFPSVPGALWRRQESWLAPDFVNAAAGEWQSSVQTWVLRSAGRTVLVDTGLGSDPSSEVGVSDNCDGGLLDRLVVL